MTMNRNELPDNPETLKGLVCFLYERLQKVERRLEHLEAELRRPRRPEEVDNSGQLYLFDSIMREHVELFGEDEAEREEISGEQDDESEGDEEPAQPRRPRGKREKAPEHLPREVRRHEIASDDPRRACPCCSKVMPEVGVRKSEQIDFRPAALFVIEHQQPTYACKGCEVVAVRQSKPAQPIERGIAGPGLLAQVIVSRFEDHLPYHRQAQMFARQGMRVSASSMSRWMQGVAQLLEPIVEHMFKDIRRSRRIHTDDTTFPVLDPGRGSTRAAKLWTYVGDSDFAHTVRTRDGPLRVLTGYRGTLQADAYSGYDCIYASGEVQEAACWAHARRKLEPCKELRAYVMVSLIRDMYEVERRARPLPESERLELRQREIIPILNEIKDHRDRLAPTVRPKSDLATAIGYLSRQWAALTYFASTGHIEPDNNIAERSLRGLAVGRRNWLFGGSLKAAQRAAILLSLVESCKRNQVNAFDYLRDVMQRISTHPSSRIAELTPAGWKAAWHELVEIA